MIFKTSDWVLHFKAFTVCSVVIQTRCVFYSRSSFWISLLPQSPPSCHLDSSVLAGILLFVILYEWADLWNLFCWIEICLVIILLQRLWVSQPFTDDPIDFPKFPFVNVIFLVFITVGQCFHDLKDTLIKKFTLHGSRIKSHQSLPIKAGGGATMF